MFNRVNFRIVLSKCMKNIDRRAFVKLVLASLVSQGCAGLPFNKAYSNQSLTKNARPTPLTFGLNLLYWSNKEIVWT